MFLGREAHTLYFSPVYVAQLWWNYKISTITKSHFGVDDFHRQRNSIVNYCHPLWSSTTVPSLWRRWFYMKIGKRTLTNIYIDCFQD